MPRPPRHQPIQSNLLATSEGPSPNQRLPVNPRRKKVAPDQRKRVATACNRCNQKRVKCSGDNPCRQCIQGARECIYPPPVEKVTVTKTELEEYQATSRDYHVQAHRLRALERLLEESGIALPPEPAHSQTPPSGPADGDAYSPSGSSPLDEQAMADTMDGDLEPADNLDQGKLLTDGRGTERFLGETSGASYLDGVKEFIMTSYPLTSYPLTNGNYNSTFLDSRGRYQTSDSQPFNQPSVDPNVLPPAAEWASMLAELSDYIQDGNGTFPSGGIFYWPWRELDTIVASLSLSSSSSSSSPSPSRGPNRHLALYHVAFAFASHLRGQPSEVYFARARVLLGNPLDISLYTLDDVPALALMALYLVESNRRDAGSMYISIAVRLSVMYGTHSSSHGSDLVDEGHRRMFWTVYIIDSWLSCLLGRPPAMPHQAITLPYPQEVVGFPKPFGLFAHAQLANISHDMVTHSYRTGKTPDNYAFIKAVMDRLGIWYQRLPNELKLNEHHLEMNENQLDNWENDGSPFLGDRAQLSLHMLYNQLNILAVRPAFLSAVKKLVAARYLSQVWLTIDTHDLEKLGCFRKSSDSARINLRIGMLIKQRIKAPGNKLLVADLHHIFNAAIILLMYRISFVNARTRDSVYLNFAKEVFEDEAKSGSEYGKDCLAVLVDMDSMVEGLREIIHYPDWKPPRRQFETWSNSTSPGAMAGSWSGQAPTGPSELKIEGDSDMQRRLEERLMSWRRNDPWVEAAVL